MTDNRTILVLSAVGSVLMIAGIILMSGFSLAWTGSVTLLVGLIVLGLGWYHFVENQRRGLWRLQTEIRNLKERQGGLAGELLEIAQGVRHQDPESTEVVLEGLRSESSRHEAKIRELERVLLKISAVTEESES
ncbi:hypothetical protein [Kocuria sp. TGY1127_2]|uniref:hypothetical protein n=1 Tax=Kocuria sp. TGY1127_2 TaxID=2711328 RepID=UPI0015B8D46E|nr:hypothetical protein [Kocuria sp. TGY1127_2]